MASPEPTLIGDLTNEEFERRTLEAIQREFGLGGVARFIMTYRSGHGDYTIERREWIENLTAQNILSEV